MRNFPAETLTREEDLTKKIKITFFCLAVDKVEGQTCTHNEQQKKEGTASWGGGRALGYE